MSYLLDGYHGETAAMAPASERLQFIRRTYLHLAGAMVAFVGASAALIATGVAETIIRDIFLANRMSWLLLMVVFIGGTFVAQYMARARESVGLQYAGLALYVCLYTVLFVPILTIATSPKFGGSIYLPLQAGIVTLAVFTGLTLAVFVSGKDFSFLGPILFVGSFIALGVILAAILFGFNLGLVFCALMVALFAGYIIYDTSNILHHYGTHEHVAASMALFGSAAMLFYYILRIFMLARNE
ncbi:MAG: Bax inhibitor-1 family protein [Gemmataceae bacterium]|nr:Bax inhibitor-1 family protein [Gemmata sp.]MDW8197688.1 Bax inhibitor-1 family protein [Gemmataceae bacterium]